MTPLLTWPEFVAAVAVVFLVYFVAEACFDDDRP